MSKNPSPIRRCKWCIKRTGQISMLTDGHWIDVPVWFNDAIEDLMSITDGICPECLEVEKKVLTLRRKVDERSVLFKRV